MIINMWAPCYRNLVCLTYANERMSIIIFCGTKGKKKGEMNDVYIQNGHQIDIHLNIKFM